MAFSFSLATVLRVRRIAEEREERLLQQIQQEIANTHQAIDQTDAAMADSNAFRHSQIDKAYKAATVLLSYEEIRLIQQRRAGLYEQLSKLESLKESQFNIYLAARRGREMLISIRDDLRGRYDSEMSRHEQRALDDIYAARCTPLKIRGK
jgi:flagellar export protein FliJ